MVSVADICKAQRAEGPATVLAIGTANPPNCVDQSTYPDYYFRITNSEHMTDLKRKFKRMCDKSMIKKRYMYLTEEILKENPNLCAYMGTSLDARQDMVVVERLMMYPQGCSAGGMVLRMAKDLAENNKGARVLLRSLLATFVKLAIAPNSEGAIDGHLREIGLTFHLLKDVPGIVSKNIDKTLFEVFNPLNISDYNSIFWIVHPGGPAILDQVEQKLGLKPEKMKVTREVLSEYVSPSRSRTVTQHPTHSHQATTVSLSLHRVALHRVAAPHYVADKEPQVVYQKDVKYILVLDVEYREENKLCLLWPLACTSMTFASLEAQILSNGKDWIEGTLMKLNPYQC
ncbi:hypothetical protein VNO78_07597 [Psophocarpus tetragonolobus]|uniref:chalcone synthase n=1 Tax=Psophocarpus tetragonolobus TaxID=3891 RepID=A0AAN9XS22_PSOTE